MKASISGRVEAGAGVWERSLLMRSVYTDSRRPARKP